MVSKKKYVYVPKKAITKLTPWGLVYANANKGVQKILDKDATKLLFDCNGLIEEKTVKSIAGNKFYNLLLNDELITTRNFRKKTPFKPDCVSKSNTFLQTPDEVFFEITERCNLKCKHCYNNTVRKNRNELSFKDISKLLKELRTNGCFNVNIGGGEPTLRPDLIKIISTGKKLNLRMSISTNCTTMTDSFAKKLKKAGINSIQISLDGPEPINDCIRGKGYFKKAQLVAKIFKTNKIPFAISLVPLATNYKEILKTAKIAKTWGAERFRSTRTIPSNDFSKNNCINKPQYIEVLNQLVNAKKLETKKFKVDIDESFKCLSDELFKGQIFSKAFDPFDNSKTCVAGRSLCGVLADGTMTPCAYLRIPCGNIKKTGFLNVWCNSKVLNEIREGNISTCNGCKHYLNGCKGGCRAVSYYTNKNLFGKDPLCNFNEF